MEGPHPDSRNRKRGRVLLLSSIVLLGVNLQQSAHGDTPDAAAHLLQMKFRAGDTFKYQTNMQLGFTLPTPANSKPASPPAVGSAGPSFTVTAVQEVRVRQVDSGGGGELDVTTTGQNTIPGQPQILTNDTRPVLMTYDAQGTLISIKRPTEVASGNPMFSAMLGQGLLSMQGVILPKKPVHVGQTWTDQMKIPGVTGAASSTIKTTLVRVENIGKYRTARLHVVISTPVSAYLDAALQPTQKASAAVSAMTGTALVTDEVDFAIAEGRVVRSVSRGVTTMNVAIGKPMLPHTAEPVRARRKINGAASTAPPTPQTGQALKVTVHTEIETNLVETPKK